MVAATAGPKGSLFAAVVEKESGFLSQTGRGRKMWRGKKRKKKCESRTRLPKNLELFPTNLTLYISLSPIQVFNLKSARRNRWVAPSLSLHKVPALSSSLPNRRVPLFLPYFLRILLHQRIFTRHRVSMTMFQGAQVPASRTQGYLLRRAALSCSPIGNSILPDNACNPLSFGRVGAPEFHTKSTQSTVKINEVFKTRTKRFILFNIILCIVTS